jgi:hypothetical protein
MPVFDRKKSHSLDFQDIPRVFDAKEQGLDPSFRLTRYANVKVGHPSLYKSEFFFSLAM